ncbi:MAG: type II secretion system protein GspG [Chitinophagaceae bacterium]|nr:type II secretion system protein GspG [Chitinophagaceae bacterium]
MKSTFLVLFASLCLAGCLPDSKGPKTKAILSQLNAGVSLYESEFGRLQIKNDGYVFSELCGGNKKMMMFIAPVGSESEKRLFLDAWNNPVRFSRSDDGSLQIISSGRDGVFGTSKNDDISLK